MSFDPARPRITLEFAGTAYELIGTMELIEAVEAAFQEGIVQISTRVMRMGLTDTARLVSVICKIPAKGVAAHIHDKMGISSEPFARLQMQLYAFLRITLEPPEAREQMAKKMGEFIGKQADSLGNSIKSSVSAS